jgi:hypothetical protein
MVAVLESEPRHFSDPHLAEAKRAADDHPADLSMGGTDA